MWWAGVILLGAAVGRAISQANWISGVLILVGAICIVLAPLWDHEAPVP